MNKKYLDQIVEDKKQNRYLFILFIWTLLFGLSLIPGLLGPLIIFTMGSVRANYSLFSIEPVEILRMCNCFTYSGVTICALAAGWYSFIKKQYAFILIIMVILPIAFLIALIIHFAI